MVRLAVPMLVEPPERQNYDGAQFRDRCAVTGDEDEHRLTRIAVHTLHADFAVFAANDCTITGLASRQETPAFDPTRARHLAEYCLRQCGANRGPFVCDVQSPDATLLATGFAAAAGAPVLRPDGTQLGVLAVCQTSPRQWTADDMRLLSDLAQAVADRSELDQLRQQVREQRGYFRQVFERAKVGMIQSGIDGTWISVNPAMCDMLGYTEDELLALGHQGITHADDVLTFARWEQIVQGKGESGVLKKRYIHKDGRAIWVQLTASFTWPSVGGPQYVVLVNNINDRMHLEEQLRGALRDAQQRADQLEVVITSMVDGVAVFDDGGRMVLTNPAYAELFGTPLPEYDPALSPQEVRLRYYDIRNVDGTPLTVDELPNARIMRGDTLRGSSAQEFLIRTPEGQEKVIGVTGQALRDDAGVITGAVSIYRDITQRQKLEQRELEHIQQLNAIFDSMTDMVFVFDANARVVTVNSAARSLMGQPEAASSLERFVILDEDGREVAPADLPSARLLRGEQLLPDESLQLIQRTTSERSIPINITGAPMRDASGTVTGAVIVARDATLRRSMEQALRSAMTTAQAHARELEAMFQAMPDAVAVYDAQGNIIKYNSSFGSLFALEDETEPGSLTDPETFQTASLRAATGEPLQAEANPVWQALHGQNPGVDEIFLLRIVDGSDHYLRITSSPVYNGDCVLVGAVAVYHDVTERYQLERLAQESARTAQKRASELETTFNAIGDGLGIVDASGRFLMVNPALRRILNLFDPECSNMSATERAARLVARNPAVSFMTEPAHPVGRLLQGETLSEPDSGDYHIPTANGREKIVTFSGAPLLDETGAVTGAVMLVRDVTERRRLEHQKDDFLTIASHELRTPLGGIKVLMQLLAAELSDAGHADLLTITTLSQRAVARMERLVNDLLDTSRIHSGRLTLRTQHADLADICRAVVKEQASVANRTIELVTPAEPVMAMVDGDRLCQALTNLLTNAVKYSAAGEPVKVTLTSNGAQAVIAVRDYGVGIDSREIPLIFERFYRVPDVSVQSGSVTGLGLGLHISREIVERQGGTLHVVSEPGHGSTFSLTLPVAAQGQPAKTN